MVTYPLTGGVSGIHLRYLSSFSLKFAIVLDSLILFGTLLNREAALDEKEWNFRVDNRLSLFGSDFLLHFQP